MKTFDPSGNPFAQQIDELSKSTLGSYVKKAHQSKSFDASDIGRMSARGEKSSEYYKLVRQKHKARGTGIDRAVDRLTKEDVEVVTELSKSTLASYTNKAAFDMAKIGQRSAKDTTLPQHMKTSKDLNKRWGGVQNATRKMAKEDVEVVTELSKDTLKSYISKSALNATRHGERIGGLNGHSWEKQVWSHQKKNNRLKGIGQAADRLAKEDVEHIDELSKDTLKSYSKKADMKSLLDRPVQKFANGVVGGARAGMRLAGKHATNDGLRDYKAESMDRPAPLRAQSPNATNTRPQPKTDAKLQAYLAQRKKEYAKEDLVNETVEALSELSKTTLGNYINAAHRDKTRQDDNSNKYHEVGHEARKAKDWEGAKKWMDRSGRAWQKSSNRTNGIRQAVSKLTK